MKPSTYIERNIQSLQYSDSNSLGGGFDEGENPLPAMRVVDELSSLVRRYSQMPEVRTRMGLDTNPDTINKLLDVGNVKVSCKQKIYFTKAQNRCTFLPMFMISRNHQKPRFPSCRPSFAGYLRPLRGLFMHDKSIHAHSLIPHTHSLGNPLYLTGSSHNPPKTANLSVSTLSHSLFTPSLPHPHHSLFLSGSVTDVKKGQKGSIHNANRPQNSIVEGTERQIMEACRPDRTNRNNAPLRRQAARPGFPDHQPFRVEQATQGNEVGMVSRENGTEQDRQGPLA